MFEILPPQSLTERMHSWVISHEGWYYMTYTENTYVTILRTQILTDWNQAAAKLAFNNMANTSYAL
jgi:hypothetical protein